MLLSAGGEVFAIGVAGKIVVSHFPPSYPSSSSNTDVATASPPPDHIIIENVSNQTKGASHAPALENGEADIASRAEPKYATPHNAGLASDRLDLMDGKWFSAMAISISGTFLAAADNLKVLRVYRLTNSIARQGALEINSWVLTKRTIALTFTPDEKSVVVADKLGDAYIYHLDDAFRKRNEPILGHISVLTDVVITFNQRFILSSDRDEKIRVSHFPMADDIQTFCLGHTEFVSKILIPWRNRDVVVSGSGDGSVRAFDYLTGAQLGSLTSFAIKREVNGRTYVVGLEFHVKLNVLLIAFHGCGTIYGYEMEVTQGNEKRLTAISFSPRFELHNRSSPSGSTTGIRSLKLLNNSLIILTNDLSDPLGFYDDFPSLISSGKRPSGGTDCIIINQEYARMPSLSVKIMDIIAAVRREERLDNLLLDTCSEFFSEGTATPEYVAVSPDVKKLRLTD